MAAGAPGPPGAAGNGQVVVAEGEDGRDGADEVAEDDVEAVVAVVPPPRAGDEDRGEEGQDCEAEEVDGRRRGLPPDGRDGLVVARDPLVAQS